MLPDGTHVYHNYPFKMKQPDGTYQIVPVTVTMKPVPVSPTDPAETGGVPKDR